MEAKVKRFFELKQKHKEIEQELGELRREIMDYGAEQGLDEWEAGRYRVKITHQERKEYDDQRLYQSLPDPDVWRMLSKADPAKIASLLKLNVISEEAIKETFNVKHVALLQVEKK